MVHDLPAVLRLAEGGAPDPRAVVLDPRTLQSTPESGDRADYDGAERRRCSKVHAAVDTFGQLLAFSVTPATTNDRVEVGRLAEPVQQVIGESVEVAYVDQLYTGEKPAAAAQAHGIALEAVKLSEARRGFVLLPRRWMVERSFVWMARFRGLARDYERLPIMLAGLHLVAFATLTLRKSIAAFDLVRNTLYAPSFCISNRHH